VHGHVWYSANQIPKADALNGAMAAVVADHYARPALIPTMPHLPGTDVRVPVLAEAARGADGVALKWLDAGPKATRATSFAIYRVTGSGAVDVEDGANLLATVRATRGVEQSFTDATAEPGTTYTYAVTALDRLWNESRPSRPKRA